MIEGFVGIVVGAVLGWAFGWHGGRHTEANAWLSHAFDIDDGAHIRRQGEDYVVMSRGLFWREYYNPLARFRSARELRDGR